MKQRFNIVFVVLFSLLFVSCNDNKIDSTLISSGSTMDSNAREAEKNLDKASYADVADVFLDTNEINFNKDVLIIFGKNNCNYCDSLKDIIKKDENLKQVIKDNFNPYYVNSSYLKIHSINFNDRQSKVNTSDIAQLFAVDFTPSIVFLSKNGDVKYLFPGFTPKFKDLVLDVVRKDNAMGQYEDLNKKIHNL